LVKSSYDLSSVFFFVHISEFPEEPEDSALPKKTDGRSASQNISEEE
jgi:hypothetical protein